MGRPPLSSAPNYQRNYTTVTCLHNPDPSSSSIVSPIIFFVPKYSFSMAHNSHCTRPQPLYAWKPRTINKLHRGYSSHPKIHAAQHRSENFLQHYDPLSCCWKYRRRQYAVFQRQLTMAISRDGSLKNRHYTGNSASFRWKKHQICSDKSKNKCTKADQKSFLLCFPAK